MKLVSFFAAMVIAAAPAFAQAQEAQSSPVAAQESPAKPEQIGFFAEPDIIGDAIGYATGVVGGGDGGEVKSGFYPELGDMITGAGWISGGPGYRQWLFDERVFVDASAALSWRMYRMAQGRVEMPRLARSRLTVGVAARWNDYTQISYFGSGPDSLEANRSEYRMEGANIVGYASAKAARWLAITTRVGWLTRPSIQPPGGTFERGYPDTATVFPDDPVYQLAEQPNFTHAGIGAVADTRDERGYPTSDGLYQASWARFTDRDAGRFSFDRYEVEGAHFFPVASDRIVLIAHGWLAGTRTAEDQVVPFYFEPSLGGSNTLRSFTSYRFHDRNLLLVNAEARVRLFTHIDWALFADAGNVAPAVGDLDFGRRSYGAGLRLHTDRATIARMDVAHGNEGWQVMFRITDPFRLSRVNKRTAPIPFVP